MCGPVLVEETQLCIIDLGKTILSDLANIAFIYAHSEDQVWDAVVES